MVGRPVARQINQHTICEVNRLATDGSPDACSALYGAAARTAQAMGYFAIITYTLATEPGTSLRAAGWWPETVSAGAAEWGRPSRGRGTPKGTGIEG